MKKKPGKVGEAPTACAAKKPRTKVAGSEAEGRAMDDATFKMAADKIFLERKELLRKLAR